MYDNYNIYTYTAYMCIYTSVRIYTYPYPCTYTYTCVIIYSHPLPHEALVFGTAW